MAIITLTTDFGCEDTFAAQMKGVILGIAPGVTLVDLTHNIPPQDILGGALALDDAADAFPPGVIHVVVVDPGVGTSRRPLAVATERETLVGPDNGVFAPLLARRRTMQAVVLVNPACRREPVSPTFHGRDLFAPAAAYLAAGTPLHDLGPPAGGLVGLDTPQPRFAPDAIEAHVLRIDRFGNLVTDLRGEDLIRWLGSAPRKSIAFEAGSLRVQGLVLTYAAVPPGESVAYVGSSGRLEIGLHGGNAAAASGALRGAVVRVTRR
jgi:hypothetical protein